MRRGGTGRGRSWPRAATVLEVSLATLPAAITVVLLLLVTQPAVQALLHHGAGWPPYAYQGLAQDVQAYQVALLSPELSAGERREFRDRALSSARNPAQFTQLGSIEALGEARLAVIERYLLEETPEAAARATREAVGLSAQAGEYARTTEQRYIGALQFMRRALFITALLTGGLSVLLTLRAARLRRAERERRARREARQREALNLASHELRRPLQSLLLASDLLRQADTPQQQTQLLGLIEDSAAQLASRADLTRLNDLYLDVTLRVQHTDLRPLVQRFAAARVAVITPQEPVVWPVDPDRLRQIIENLVENALRYTDDLVEVTLRGGPPVIEVRDHGPGLSDALRDRVFVPYEQGPQALRAGQGLGLPLARRYARAHGGDVTLANASGGGLRATVQLGQPLTLLSDAQATLPSV